MRFHVGSIFYKLSISEFDHSFVWGSDRRKSLNLESTSTVQLRYFSGKDLLGFLILGIYLVGSRKTLSLSSILAFWLNKRVSVLEYDCESIFLLLLENDLCMS